MPSSSQASCMPSQSSVSSPSTMLSGRLRSIAMCAGAGPDMAIALNLPLSIVEGELTELWDGMHEACDELGIAVISGHTARYQGCDYPMVGGATVFAVGDAERYVTSGTARDGDVLICTKGAAIEATAVFAATFPEALRARVRGEPAARAAAPV